MSADLRQLRSASVPAGDKPAAHEALPAGTRFGEFEIIRVIGIGGFAIVYLAHDHSLERRVALKEYMPAALAGRGKGRRLTLRSGPSVAETYAIGLHAFMNEARLLARFDHPSLVKVYRFWEENATAYMVMPFLQGITLRDARQAMRRSPDEAWIRSVIDPVLDALELLHRQGVYHCDIAPDNIMLPSDGPPILLDFGAARRVIGDRTQSLSSILKPCYAPIEQYAETTSASLRQGPWTDLYALGAVVYYLLFDTPPEPATARALVDDAIGTIVRRQVPGVSPRMIRTVAWLLAVRPLDRPQDVAAVRAALDGEVGGADPMRQGTDPEASRFEVAPAPKSRWSDLWPPRRATVGRFAAGATLVLVLAAGLLWQFVTLLGSGRHSAALTAATSAPARTASAMDGGMSATPRQSATRATTLPVPVAATTAAVASSASVLAPAPGTPSSIGSRSSPALAAAADAGKRVALASSAMPASVASGPGRARAAKPARSDTALPPLPSGPVSAVASDGGSAVPAPAAETADVATGAGRSAPATASPPEPASARAACGSRVFLALALCMERECEAPRYRSSPDCVSVIEIKRNREARYQ